MAKFILCIGLILLGGAVYALHTDKMMVVEVCHDTRLYMDGGTDAELMAGGLNYHHSVKIFIRQNNKDVFVHEYPIESEDPQTYVSNEGLKLSLGHPSHVQYSLGGVLTTVNLNCSPKKLF